MTMRAIESGFGSALPSFSFRSRKAIFRLTSLVAALALCFSTSLIHAAAINYGNFMGNTVTYVGVTEDSNSGDATPLFGAPTVSGDSIDFNPVGFSANATGAGGVDVTDGQLLFMVVAKPGSAIENFQLSEAGDVTLAGFGTDATFASVSANVFLNISEVNGFAVNTISVPLSMAFTPSGGTFGLGSDGGGGPLYNSAWSGNLFINLNAIVAANNLNGKATKITVNIDNTLVALSQANTFSLIAKKDFGGVSITVNRPPGNPIVPEPTSAALVGLAVFGLAAGRRFGR